MYAPDAGSHGGRRPRRHRLDAPPTRSTPASAWCTSTSCSCRRSPSPRTSCSAASRDAGCARPRARDRRRRTLWRRSTGCAVRRDRDSSPTCRVGEAQRVEILKTLYRGARILILDEPTAVLSPPEVAGALARAAARCATRGETIVLITHKLDEVMADLRPDHRHAARRDGRAAASPTSTTPAEIAKAMVGRDVQLAGRRRRSAASAGDASARLGEPLLGVADLVVDERATAARGERRILHRRAAARSSASPASRAMDRRSSSRRSPDCGRVGERLDPPRRAATSPASPCASAATPGSSHIPEDRHARGLILDYSVAENLILGQQHRFTRGVRLDRARILDNARAADRGVRHPPDRSDRCRRARSRAATSRRSSSRARWGARFSVLLAAQPTRGVDVGAIEFIHAQLRAARAAGKAMLLVSADLPEILALVRPHRRDVRRAHRRDSCRAREASERRLGPFMTGAGADAA